MQTARAALLVLALASSAAAAAEPQPPATTIEVERVKAKEPNHPTVRFLRENRDFLRAQLDLLRQKVKSDTDGDAILLSERHLMFKEMLEAIAAARDSSRNGTESIARRELLASVTEIGELESQMDLMEQLLQEQGERLSWLEQDFVGRQRTALVILLRGLPPESSPSGVIVRSEEGETLRIALTAQDVESLRQGGVAQIFHRFVEPRRQEFEISLDGAQWGEAAGQPIAVEPQRDRLTFLELDLARVAPSGDGGGIGTRVWAR